MKIKNYFITLCFTFFNSIFINSLPAQSSLVLEKKQPYYILENHLAYFVDFSKRLDFEAVKQKEFQKNFIYQPTRPLNFGYVDAVYWFRVRLDNRYSTNNWLLRIQPEHLDSITVYFPLKNGKILIKQTGDLIPAKKREIQSAFLVFAIPADLTNNQDIWIKIAANGSNKRFKFQVVDNQHFINLVQEEWIIFGIFAGVCWVMFFYNFFIFISTRERSYLYYILFILFLWFSHTMTDGYFNLLLPHAYYKWLNVGDLFLLGLNFGFYILFTRRFLNLAQKAPIFDWILLFSTFMGGLLSIASLLAVVYPTIHLTVTKLTGLFILVNSLLSFVVGLIVLQTKYRPARFYMLASSAFLICIMLRTLMLNGILPVNFVTSNSIEIGTILQMVLLSLGMADRINLMEAEKNQNRELAIRALEENDRLIQEQTRILEEKVNQRTEDLALKNQKLIELNEEKNNLIAVVSHDLKSPLSRVLGLSELIKFETERLSTEQLDYLDKMQMIARQAGEMIKQLLDLDTIENQKRALLSEEIDLQTEIENLISNYHSAIQQKKLEILWEKNFNKPLIISDLQYIQRILDNLFSNAVKFSPFNRQIFVRLIEKATTFRIEFQDQGPGLTDQDKTKLFKKFQRLSSQPTGGETSTGLGLAIVKTLVEELKGKITCESELGKGANFMVELPKELAINNLEVGIK
jgi:signal transduction histidine kinase